MLSTRYTSTFKKLKKQKRLGFCPFAILGDSTEEECIKRVTAYINAGADMLELGIPFSDPIADGPIVAQASQRALDAGITTKKCITLIKKIRTATTVPIGILCYANSVHAYGIESFYKDIAKAGADSVLIADCPPEELAPFYNSAHKNGIHCICIVTQDTDRKRLKIIEKFATGFLYVVSTLGVTGTRTALNPKIADTIKFLKKSTTLPLSIGFGLSSKEHLCAIQKAGADCGIVGSYLVKRGSAELPAILDKLDIKPLD